MRIAPISLNTVSQSAFLGKRKPVDTTEPFQTANEADVFVKREDNYTKKYKELLSRANDETRLSKDYAPCINLEDIEFLLEIKDDKKFKNLVTTPVSAMVRGDEADINIFFFTDAKATAKLAKRLGDRQALKKLLSQKTPYNSRTVFFTIAQNDDVEKAKALRKNLSAKEFKRFMSARDYLYDTPYSIAQEKNGALKAMLDPIFADET